MNLRNKKKLAARSFKIGKDRIVFLKSRIEEIKEAITRQDIRDLKKEGAIVIKEIRGKRKKKRKSKRRVEGRVRKKVKKRKKKYVILTRKLRKYVSEMKKRGNLSREEVVEIRKKIRNKLFRSLSHLKEHVRGMRK